MNATAHAVTQAGGSRVSVVVAAFNAQRYLRECLDSILSQRGVDVELIVVDDGSTDRTAEIAAGYGDALRLVRQTNSAGCSSPRNHGATLATSPYLTFFDADDVMVQGKLAIQARALATNPRCGCVVTDYRNFDESRGTSEQTHFATCAALGRLLSTAASESPIELGPFDVRALLQDEHFSIAGSPMFRRGLFDAVGGYDESLQASEDFDLLYRCALREPVTIVPRVGFHRRLHGSNMTSRAVHMLAQQGRSRAKLAELEPDPALRHRLLQASHRYRIALVEELGRQGETAAALRALRGAWPALASREGVRALAWGLTGPIVRRWR